MNHWEPEYWPFAVPLPAQQTEENWCIVRFFEEAYRCGFRPYRQTDLAYSAGDPDGRFAEVFYRGRERGKRRWEVLLFDAHRRALHCWANDFAAVAAAALAWLGGEPVESALDALEGHIIRGPAVWPDEVPAAVG